MILLVQLPSLSTLLHFKSRNLITWFKSIIDMHPATPLTVQVYAFLLCVCFLTCCFRACVGTGYHQLLFLTLLATRNRICRLLSPADILLQPLDVLIHWYAAPLSIYWPCSFFATAGRTWLLQVSGSAMESLPLHGLCPPSWSSLSIPADTQLLYSHTKFQYLRKDELPKLVPTFLAVCLKYEYHRLINSYIIRWLTRRTFWCQLGCQVTCHYCVSIMSPHLLDLSHSHTLPATPLDIEKDLSHHWFTALDLAMIVSHIYIYFL